MSLPVQKKKKKKITKTVVMNWWLPKLRMIKTEDFVVDRPPEVIPVMHHGLSWRRRHYAYPTSSSYHRAFTPMWLS